MSSTDNIDIFFETVPKCNMYNHWRIQVGADTTYIPNPPSTIQSNINFGFEVWAMQKKFCP